MVKQSLKEFPYVQQKKSYRKKTGSTELLYFRKPGAPRVKLRGPIGSKNFKIDYQLALEGKLKNFGQRRRPKTKNPRPQIRDETFAWLVHEYKKSANWLMELEPSTKARRDRIHWDLCFGKGGLGKVPYRSIKKGDIRRLMDTMSDTPGGANDVLKTLRSVYRYAEDYLDLEVSPARLVPFFKAVNPNGWHCWTERECEQFEDFHPIGTKPRLAYSLAIYSAQRVSDIVRLGPAMVHPLGNTNRSCLRFTQFKGRKRNPINMMLPILPQLQTVLDASDIGDETYLKTRQGKPYTAKGWWAKMNRWTTQAGLTDCSTHGLRKAACGRMASLGLTTMEIMSISGHTTVKEVERYTREYNREMAAKSAMDKMAARLSEIELAA